MVTFFAKDINLGNPLGDFSEKAKPHGNLFLSKRLNF